MTKKTVMVDIGSMIQSMIQQVAERANAGAISPRLFQAACGVDFLTLSREDFSSLDNFCRECRLGHSLNDYMNGLESLARNNATSEDLPFLVNFLNRLIKAHREGNMDAAEGWLNALYVGLKTANIFIPKAQLRFKADDALPRASKAGGQATKEHSRTKKEKLHQKVAEYMAMHEPRRKERNLPKITAKKCRDDLTDGNRVCGYAPWYALKLIQEIFKEERPSSEAESGAV